MAEPFARPNNQQVEKLRQTLGDPFLFSLTKSLIKHLNKKSTGKLSPQDWAGWKTDTMLIIKNYGLNYVLNHLEFCVIECGKTTEQRLKEFDFSIFEKENNISNFNISIDPTAKLLKDKVPIIAVAQKYGLKVKNKKSICPFHKDQDPSLVFYTHTNTFFCFGCRQGGDLIKFVQLMEDLKK